MIIQLLILFLFLREAVEAPPPPTRSAHRLRIIIHDADNNDSNNNDDDIHVVMPRISYIPNPCRRITRIIIHRIHR